MTKKTKIAVYGASGFTGALTVVQLRERGVAVLPVGRSRARLTALGFEPEAVRVAGLDDPDALAAAFEGASAVVNCAGPFRDQGEPVVAAAIAAGCHYVDITGEQGYLHRLFERWAAPAQEAGVSVLPAMTDDGAPGDLIATLTAAALAASSQPASPLPAGTPTTEGRNAPEVGAPEALDGVTVADLRSGGAPTRGTVRTGWVNAEEMDSAGLTYLDGEWHAERAKRAGSAAGEPDRIELPSEIQQTIRETSMEDPTRATGAAASSAQGPDERWVNVRPAPLPGVVTIPRHLPARTVRAVIRSVGTELDRPWGALTAEAVEAVPEGPSRRERAASSWLMLTRVTGTRGSEAVGAVSGTDPYGATAVIASEAVVRLVAGGAPAGVLAPSMAFDAEDFLDSLAPYGVRWQVVRTVAPPAG